MSLAMKVTISFAAILIWIFISILVKRIPDAILCKERIEHKINKELYNNEVRHIRNIIRLLIFWNIIISIFMWFGSEFILILFFCESLSCLWIFKIKNI